MDRLKVAPDKNKLIRLFEDAVWPHQQEFLSQLSHLTKLDSLHHPAILDWLIYWWLDLVFSWPWRWSSSVGWGCHGGGDLHAWDNHHEHQDRDEVRNIQALRNMLVISLWYGFLASESKCIRQNLLNLSFPPSSLKRASIPVLWKLFKYKTCQFPSLVIWF